jgi:hypothetical protein
MIRNDSLLFRKGDTDWCPLLFIAAGPARIARMSLSPGKREDAQCYR